MFDVFVGNLRCPSCGKDPPPDTDTSMQTHIRGVSADGSSLGVGFRFEPNDVTTDSILESGYTLIKEAGPHQPIRILDIWTCPSCNTEQWGMVEILDRTIRRVEGVKLDRKTLESANFISEDNAGYLADSLLGESPIERSTNRPSTLEVLRQRLP
jgi:hypothetical protein